MVFLVPYLGITISCPVDTIATKELQLWNFIYLSSSVIFHWEQWWWCKCRVFYPLFFPVLAAAASVVFYLEESIVRLAKLTHLLLDCCLPRLSFQDSVIFLCADCELQQLKCY